MSTPKRHHYLPKFYLNYFTDDFDKFWVYDRQRNEYRIQTPINTAAINNYYSIKDKNEKKNNEIEQMFSSIERDVKPIIDKLAFCEKINLNEKSKLAIFIATLEMRTPAFEKDYNYAFEKTMNKILKMHHSESQDTLEFMKKHDVKIVPNRNLSLQAMMDQLNEVAHFFMQMDWVVFLHNKKTFFVTCDNPFFLYPPVDFPKQSFYGYGLLTPGASKYIPLTAKTAITMYDVRSDKKAGNVFYKMIDDRKSVRLMNCDIAANTERFLIGKDKGMLERIVKITKIDTYKKSRNIQVS